MSPGEKWEADYEASRLHIGKTKEETTMNDQNTDTKPEDAPRPSSMRNPRLVRRWWDTDYPIIARLNHNTFDLVAHPNGPALCDGDMMASIDTHPDDSRELMKLKMQAQAAWREYAWPLVKGNFYPTNAERIRAEIEL